MRLYLSFTIGTPNQYLHDLREIHMNLTYRVLQYLKRKISLDIMFIRNAQLTLDIYVDTNCVDCTLDQKSTLEYCVFLRKKLITWHNAKPSVFT